MWLTIIVFWKCVIYSINYAEIQRWILWLFIKPASTVPWFLAPCQSSVPHPLWLHLSPLIFLEIYLILHIWNIYFLISHVFISDPHVWVMSEFFCPWTSLVQMVFYLSFLLFSFFLSFSPSCISLLLSHCLTPSCAFIPSRSFVNLLLQESKHLF